MKKRLCVWILMLCLLLTACTGEIKPTTQPGAANTKPSTTQPDLSGAGADDLEPMPGLDAQNKYLLTTAASFQELDGVFCGSNMGGNYLQYYDQASGISGALCADPTCTHDSADCGSYAESHASLCYYGGKLYWIGKDADSGNDFILWRSDLSGMNREKVIRLSYQDVIMEYQPQRFVIHRGKLYILGQASSVTGAQVGLRVTLLSTPLNGADELTVLYDETFESGIQPTVRFVGNYVYLSMTVFKGTSYDWTITRFNTRTGTSETIYAATEMTEVPGAVWVTDQGEVYLSAADANYAYVWKLENGVRNEIISWEGKNLAAPKLVDGAAFIISKENGIRSIKIKSLDGETIYEGLLFPEGVPGVDGDPNEYYYGIVGGDADKIILIIQNPTDTEVNYTIMLDLSSDLKPTILWSTQE